MPEYGAPPQVKPKRLGDYLEVMSKAVFQSGMSWQVVTLRTSALLAACEGLAGFSAKFLKNGGFHTP